MADSKDWRLEEELAQARPTWTNMRRLGGFIAPYRKPIVTALVMEIGWCFSYLAGPHLVRIAIDSYLVAGAETGLALVCLAYAGNTLLRACWIIVEIRLLARCGQRILGDMRRAVFEHVQTLSMSFFDRTQHGRIIARVDRDVDALEHPLVWGPVILTSAVFLLIFALSSMAYYDYRLSLVVIICVPTLVLSSEIFRRRGMRAYRDARAALSRVTAHYAETINGMRIIQATVQENKTLAEGRRLIRRLQKTALRTIMIWSAYLPAVSMHYGIGGAAILIYGGALVMRGELTIGELVAFLLLLESVFEPIEQLGELYNELLGAAAAGERVFQVLDTQPEIQDRTGAGALSEVKGRVTFSHVHFRYGPELPWIVRGASFAIEPGTTAAFVGHTGAGKTSIIALLCRFYEAQEGHVRIDGRDVRDIRLTSLRDHVGVIPQDGYLFSGTVMDNLRFGHPDATDDEILNAAKSLGAHEVLEALADGYATDVGERGGRLSHGERQVVCYVRALLADPAILVLDEATSAMDAATEKTLQRALARLTTGRTTVVIAHRLSTVRAADRIYVVDRGTIVEQGDHESLLRLSRRYAELYGDYKRTRRRRADGGNGGA
ncbi:MAG: ABC transporter ATP-binding protein [Elusimicrobiota bacterium]